MPDREIASFAGSGAAPLRSTSPLPPRSAGAPSGARVRELPCAASSRRWRSLLGSRRPRRVRAPGLRRAPVTYVAPVSGTVTDPFRPPSRSTAAATAASRTRPTPGQPRARRRPAASPSPARSAARCTSSCNTTTACARATRSCAPSACAPDSVVDAKAMSSAPPVDASTSAPASATRTSTRRSCSRAVRARVHLVPDGEFDEVGASDDRQSALLDRRHRRRLIVGAWARAVGECRALEAAPRCSRPAQLAAAPPRQVRASEHLVTRARRGGEHGRVRGAVRSVGGRARRHPRSLVRAVHAGQTSRRRCATRRTAWSCSSPASVRTRAVAAYAENLSQRVRRRRRSATRARDVVRLLLSRWARPAAVRSQPTPSAICATTPRDLRDLLDQIAHDHPGVPVDLVAHSQGGLIAREALADDYDGPTHALPPSRTSSRSARRTTVPTAPPRWPGCAGRAAGRAIRRLAEEFHTSFDLTGPGVAQLSETSDFIRDLNDRPLRDGVAYTSIAACRRSHRALRRGRGSQGATNVLVDAGRSGRYPQRAR